MTIDRDIFFREVRPIFGGNLTQQQVDGMNFKLGVWEDSYDGLDLRWLANPLAQSKWETSSTMWPVEEYGHGGSAAYAQKDPETGQCYWGRGDIQLTWRENYAKADAKLGLTGAASCEWHAENALDPATSAAIMFKGMQEGWFRSSGGTPNTLAKYFNDTVNNVYAAREIVNGDAGYYKDWAGMTVGNYIKKDHEGFLAALELSYIPTGFEPVPVVSVIISAPAGVKVEVQVIEDEA